MHIFKWKDFLLEGGVLHFYICDFFTFWKYEGITLSLFILKYFPQKESLKTVFQHKKRAVDLHEHTRFPSHAAVCQLISEHHKNIP